MPAGSAHLPREGAARCSRPAPRAKRPPCARRAGQLPCAVRVTSAVRAGWWPPEASKLILLVCLWLRVPPPCPGCRRGPGSLARAASLTPQPGSARATQRERTHRGTRAWHMP